MFLFVFFWLEQRKSRLIFLNSTAELNRKRPKEDFRGGWRKERVSSLWTSSVRYVCVASFAVAASGIEMNLPRWRDPNIIFLTINTHVYVRQRHIAWETLRVSSRDREQSILFISAGCWCFRPHSFRALMRWKKIQIFMMQNELYHNLMWGKGWVKGIKSIVKNFG